MWYRYDDAVPKHVLDYWLIKARESAYTKFENSTVEAETHHHSINIDKVKFSESELYKKVLELVSVFDSEYDIDRVYINELSFGDITGIHKDSDNNNDITVIIYLVEEWSKEWGGETLFYHDGEQNGFITPKRGRIVFFNSVDYHVGRAPERTCPVSRYTLAIKLKERISK